jgi:hypothetical protein
MGDKSYLLLDEDGDPIGLAGDRETALEMAWLVSPEGSIYLDGPTAQNEASIAAGDADVQQLRLAANPPPKLRVIQGGYSDVMHGAPAASLAALQAAMVRAGSRDRGEPAFDYSYAVNMDLSEAHERIRDFFPTLKYTKKDQSRRNVNVYKTPAKMAGAILGQNFKTAKGTPKDIIGALRRMTGFSKANVLGLSILPHTQSYTDASVAGIMGSAADLYGVRRVEDARLNACVRASPECASSCLAFSGRNLADDYNSVKKYALLASLVHEPDAFLRMLIAAIAIHRDKSYRASTMPLVRLNVFSDLPWEQIAPELFEEFSDVQFYDYTKVPARTPPTNYDLTFSFAGTDRNVEGMDFEIKRGRRVAVVFAAVALKPVYQAQWINEDGGAEQYEGSAYKTKRLASERGGKVTRIGKQRYPKTPKFYRRKAGKTQKTSRYARLPEEFLGLKVIDADVSDMRPYDPAPSIVGLRWKNPANQNVTMDKAEVFVVEVDLVKGRGGFFDAIVSKTARFDDVDYAKYAPSNVDD